MKKSVNPWLAAILVFGTAFWGAAGSAGSAQPSGQEDQQRKPPQENLSASVDPNGVAAEQEKSGTPGTEARPAADDIVVKTYSLKYIGWREVVEAAKFYLVNWTGSDATLTVMIRKNNIADFEAVLRKLDIEKKSIQFRVYTIVASRDNPPDDVKRPETIEIGNRDLKNVLDELRGLWNFRHYWVDAPSLLTVKDGSMSNYFKLVSQNDIGLQLAAVKLTGDEPGKRIVSVGSVRLTQYTNPPSEEEKSTLIDTRDVSIKEKGYLVVGVSGLERAGGLALILVISAEIK